MTDPEERRPEDEELARQGYLGLDGSLTGSPDPHIRQYAAYLLGGAGEVRALESLIAALHDPEKGVRAQAMRALVELGSPAVEPLLGLLDDQHWVIRYRAAEALGLIGGPQVVRPLVNRLADEKDHVRYMAAKGLGRVGGAGEIEALITVLADNNEFVRRSAATALGALGGEAARRALIRAGEEEPVPAVQTAIQDAIRRIGDGPAR